MRVLAAMSGGVDSAVAAARMAEAGHDVVGVHLALSRNPQSYRSGARGCCTIEDSRDARRAADVIGIPFYVWDLAERFHADVVEDFVSEYAAGRTPNPCLRCNEKVKFSAVLERALALDFDAVATGHYARIVDTPDRRSRAAPGGGSGQGPVVRARGAHAGSSSSTRSSRSVTRSRPRCGQRPSGAGCRWRPSRTVTTSASLPTATLRASSASSWVRRPGDIVDAQGNKLGEHKGTHGFTVGQRKGLRIGTPAADGKPRFVLDISPVDRTVTVGSREELAVAQADGVEAALVRSRRRRPSCT